MGGDQSSYEQKDASALAGLLILGAAVAAACVSRPFELFSVYERWFSSVWKTHDGLVIAVLIALGVNFIFLASTLARVFSGTLQGRRLQALEGADGRSMKPDMRGLGAALLLGVFSHVLLAHLWLPEQLRTLPVLSKAMGKILGHWIRWDFSVAVGCSVFLLSRLPLWKWVARATPRRLPPFPKLKNSLVIGSFDEGEGDCKPTWAVLGPRALVGNILITGSIGSGKSAGTIFPFASQILENFSPRPALLGIDPKGKITSEILKITSRLNLDEHVLHMNAQVRIGQDQTFFRTLTGCSIDHDNFVDRYFEKDIAEAGVKRIRFHDLRHTGTTLMIADGLDIKTVQEICGHKDIATTMRYVHLLGDSLKKAGRTFSVVPGAEKPALHVVGG